MSTVGIVLHKNIMTRFPKSLDKALKYYGNMLQLLLGRHWTLRSLPLSVTCCLHTISARGYASFELLDVREHLFWLTD